MASTSARRIRITNPDLSVSEKLVLDADYSTGTTVTVKSNFGLQDNDIVVFEEPGSEKAEAGSVASTTGNTTINLDAALKFSHQKGTIIYRSEYDQVSIDYRTSSSGSWTSLDTIGIKWDDHETIKIHQGATSAYEYRFRFYNSQSTNYSEYSPTVSGAGYTASQVGRQLDNVRLVIKDPDRKIVTDTEIIAFLTEAKNVIKARKNDWWFWLKKDEGTITTVGGSRTYDLDDISTRIEYIKDVRFRDQSTDDILYPIKYYPDIEFDQYITDMDESEDDHVTRYTLLPGDSSSTSGYIKVDPIPDVTGNGSFYIRYYEPDADYDDVADTISIPLPFILSDYAIAKCLEIKGQLEQSAIYFSKFYGPSADARNRSTLTGIALLEQMQIGKLRPIRQTKALKYFRGRKAISRFYDRAGVDRDAIAEGYFNYPIK